MRTPIPVRSWRLGARCQEEELVKRLLVGCLLVMVLGMTQGCANYFQNRISDAGEIIDLGVTVSKKPQFSAFVIFPPIHLTLIGVGEVDGWFAGLGGGKPRGFSPYFQRSIGLLLIGEELVSFDKGWDEISALDENGLREQATFYRSGVFGLMEGPLPPEDYWVSCPHYLHLGWFGFVLSPRYNEALDFVLGFTTLDISGDDVAGKE